MKASSRKTYVIIIACLAILGILTAGCGTKAPAGNGKGAGTANSDTASAGADQAKIEDVLGEEQAGLMQDYDAMEISDLSEEQSMTGTASAEDKGASDSEQGAASAEDTGSSGSGQQAETSAPDAGKAEDEISIIMVGDILLHTPVEEAAYDPDGDKYNYDFIFVNTKDDINAADIAIVNQEVIIGGRELGVSGYPSFNASYEIGDALVNAGFDIVCHATNHAMDKGAKGIKNCVSYWAENHPDILMTGIRTKEADGVDLYHTKDPEMTIAVLNYTYGINGIPLPSDMPYAVSMLNEQKVISDLKAAEEIADFTIVIPHWGTEYAMGVSPEQRKWAKLFTENGADLIMGAHPHVIEPIEWVETDNAQDVASDDAQATGGEGAKNRALCYYSLGNFVNWTSGTGAGVANRMIGGMAKVTLKKDADGSVRISQYGVEPLICHVESGREGVTVYRLSDYDEQMGQRNEIRAQDPDFSYGYAAALTEEMWGEAMEGIKVTD